MLQNAIKNYVTGIYSFHIYCEIMKPEDMLRSNFQEQI